MVQNATGAYNKNEISLNKLADYLIDVTTKNYVMTCVALPKNYIYNEFLVYILKTSKSVLYKCRCSLSAVGSS